MESKQDFISPQDYTDFQDWFEENIATALE
jgi:hypothetical protein